MNTILQKINKQFEWGFLKNKSHHFVNLKEHPIHRVTLVYYVIDKFKICGISEEELIEIIKSSDLNWANSAGTTPFINLLFKIAKKEIVFSATQEEDILNYIIRNSDLKLTDFSMMQAIHLFIHLSNKYFFNIDSDTIDYWIKHSDINTQYDSTENLLNYYLLNINIKKPQLSAPTLEWLITNTQLKQTNISTFLYNILFKKDFYPLTDEQLHFILSKGDINQTVEIDKDNRNFLFIYLENISSGIYKNYIPETQLDMILKHTNLNHISNQHITALELIFAIEFTPNIPNTNITLSQLKYIISNTTTNIQLDKKAIEALIKKISNS